MQRVQGGSFVDPAYQLKRNRQWQNVVLQDSPLAGSYHNYALTDGCFGDNIFSLLCFGSCRYWSYVLSTISPHSQTTMLAALVSEADARTPEQR
jgi:hypothetical protein